jgi:hypothetical protein
MRRNKTFNIWSRLIKHNLCEKNLHADLSRLLAHYLTRGAAVVLTSNYQRADVASQSAIETTAVSKPFPYCLMREVTISVQISDDFRAIVATECPTDI